MTTQQDIYPQEWITLQHQYDSYEKYSLLVKLANVVLISTLLFTPTNSLLVPILSALLWLQDGIWKTFQNRIYERLLIVEKALLEENPGKGMQFNSAWQDTRPGTLQLVVEYLSQALRPTVAYPHALLLIIALLASNAFGFSVGFIV